MRIVIGVLQVLDWAASFATPLTVLAMLGKFLSLCMPLMPESENDASMELPPMRLMQA